MTKTQKIVYYILLVLVTALFLFTAYDKLSGDPMAIQGFALVGLPVWFMYMIGISELLGAIGLWIDKTRFWAALGLFEILAGAVVTTAIFVSVPLALLPLLAAVALFFVVKLGKKRSQIANVQ